MCCLYHKFWLNFCKHTDDVNWSIVLLFILKFMLSSKANVWLRLHFPLHVPVIWICIKCVRTVGEDAMCGHLHAGNFADHEIAILWSSVSRRTRRGQTWGQCPQRKRINPLKNEWKIQLMSVCLLHILVTIWVRGIIRSALFCLKSARTMGEDAACVTMAAILRNCNDPPLSATNMY